RGEPPQDALARGGAPLGVGGGAEELLGDRGEPLLAPRFQPLAARVVADALRLRAGGVEDALRLLAGVEHLPVNDHEPILPSRGNIRRACRVRPRRCAASAPPPP